MDALFLFAIVIVVIGLFSAFLKGIYTILPIGLQNTLSRISELIDEVSKILVLLAFPFIFAYIGNLRSTIWSVVGGFVGLLIGIGIRQAIIEGQRIRALASLQQDSPKAHKTTSSPESTSSTATNNDNADHIVYFVFNMEVNSLESEALSSRATCINNRHSTDHDEEVFREVTVVPSQVQWGLSGANLEFFRHSRFESPRGKTKIRSVPDSIQLSYTIIATSMINPSGLEPNKQSGSGDRYQELGEVTLFNNDRVSINVRPRFGDFTALRELHIPGKWLTISLEVERMREADGEFYGLIKMFTVKRMFT